MIDVRVPTSKSLTQRALVLAALAPGRSVITDPLDCDDSRALRRALTALGVVITETGQGLAVDGGGGPLRAPAQPLDLENAGTATRFLTGLTLLADGPVTLDGNQAMRRRPMPGLLAALGGLGARVQENGRPACPPITIHPPADLADLPPRIVLDAAGSSQQLSALLLTAPRLPAGLTIELAGDLPSKPYVDLTLDSLAAFGVTVTVDVGPGPHDGPAVYRVEPSTLRAASVTIEGDHSSASYPLAAGFLTDQRVRVTNARADSRQGDRVFGALLEGLGQPAPRTFDLADTPDIAPTLATCALFAKGETRLTGLAHLRIKECDRLSVLATGFRQVGADLDELPDGLVIRPTQLHGDVDLDPSDDHRMAMCFALLGLRLGAIRINDRHCVSKSYPDFFEMLSRFAPS
jgi:3-phosphoshikimate 1-carboxyvinyltransferase